MWPTLSAAGQGWSRALNQPGPQVPDAPPAVPPVAGRWRYPSLSPDLALGSRRPPSPLFCSGLSWVPGAMVKECASWHLQAALDCAQAREVSVWLLRKAKYSAQKHQIGLPEPHGIMRKVATMFPPHTHLLGLHLPRGSLKTFSHKSPCPTLSPSQEASGISLTLPTPCLAPQGPPFCISLWGSA